MAYLFRIYNSYLGANILMYDKMDESEYPYLPQFGIRNSA